jgi:L-amino acid N-acyltransferase YncA
MPPVLRLAREEDAEALLAIYAPLVRETPISFELTPPGLDEFRGRITTILESMPWLVCEEDGVVLGYAYASRFRPRPAYQWTVETTVYVDSSHQGRGAGRALYETLFSVLRLQGYHRALAVIALPNPASVALHEKVGFTPVGVFHDVGYKLDRWHDVGFWQLSLQELPPEPPAPRSLDSVARSAPFLDSLQKGAALVKTARS